MSSTGEIPGTATEAAGDVIADRYRILEKIGHGGMAEVFRAQDESLGRDVALKIFRRELASADDLRRQQTEVRLLAGLSHPSLVTLFDATSDADGRGVLVLEFVTGTDVRARLADGALSGPTVAAIGADIARALAYLHSQGVVHRDISPANILLPESPATGVAAKLTDLGIARLVDDAKITATGSVLGTASYMSPEQALGWPLSGLSDVYSLGLVLLECLTGRREFPGTLVESAAARLSRDPEMPAGLNPEWSRLLSAMTARDPERRPAAEAAAAQLAGLLDQDAWAAAGDEATEVLTAPMESAVTGTGSTLVLPVADAPEPSEPPTAGEWLTAGERPSAEERSSTGDRPPAAERPAVRWSRPRLLRVALAVDALVAVVAIVLAVVTLSAGERTAPDPVGTYPPVSGTLGDHLKQLEHEVSRGWTP